MSKALGSATKTGFIDLDYRKQRAREREYGDIIDRHYLELRIKGQSD